MWTLAIGGLSVTQYLKLKFITKSWKPYNKLTHKLCLSISTAFESIEQSGSSHAWKVITMETLLEIRSLAILSLT